MGRAVTVKDVPAQKFVEAYAAHLKKAGKVTLPAWVDIAKTSCHKELPPQNPDWFYIRCGMLISHTSSVALEIVFITQFYVF